MRHHYVEVAIVGAGPYGLSIAAYLKKLGLSFRIFGRPMQSWREHMPEGMYLKSEGFASTLYDPDFNATLAAYCHQHQIPYKDTGLPVPLDLFNSYGLDFQKRCVPEVEEISVTSICRTDMGFDLRLDNGENLSVRKVVVATGLSNFEYIPPPLSGLPDEFVTHSSRHRSLDGFKGRDVTVLGAGASALDLAGLLHTVGAHVRLYARKPTINFHNPPGKLPRPILERLRAPMSGLGPGWRSYLCTAAPLLFHNMPEQFRLEVVKRHLGPAPGWTTKDLVLGRVPLHLGYELEAACIKQRRVQLKFHDSDGTAHELLTEHVIAGTGYRTNISRLPFLSAELKSSLLATEGAPVLGSSFQSCVDGLYFVGPAAAVSFGPMLRFVYGAGFTCRRLLKHLAGSRHRQLANVLVPA